jgi:hypothetical protein
MIKKKGKVVKTMYVDYEVADWIDTTSLRLTRTARGNSALANEAFKFIRAHIANFEAWWNNRDGKK